MLYSFQSPFTHLLYAPPTHFKDSKTEAKRGCNLCKVELRIEPGLSDSYILFKGSLGQEATEAGSAAFGWQGLTGRNGYPMSQLYPLPSPTPRQPSLCIIGVAQTPAGPQGVTECTQWKALSH